MYTNEDIEKVKSLVLKVLKPEKIILFGSYATGNCNNDSDVDIMILVKEKMTRKQKLKNLYQLRSLFFDNDFEVDLILNDLKHFEDYKNLIGSINYSVAREGEVLWTKS